MALPTYVDLKTYLKIEHDVEDSLLQALMVRARAVLEGLLGDLPLTTEEGTFRDPSQEGIQFKEPRTLIVPKRPIGGTVSVTDRNGDTVDSTTYDVDGIGGMINAKFGGSFPLGPYDITCSYGLQYSRGYETRVEPLLGTMLIDLAADLYQRRTPAAAAESAAGTSVTWNASAEVITRIMPHVKQLRKGVARA